MVIQLGVLLPADAEQAEVDQADRGGGHPVTIEMPAAQIPHGGRPQRGQRAGEAEHVRELLGVALLAPHLVIPVLGPAAAVDAGGLDVTERVGEIQTSFQAGGIPRAPMRRRVSGLVTSAPRGSR